MARSYLDPPLPILAQATPPGRSALALLRATGPGCIELLARRFSRPVALRDSPGRSLVLGWILDAGGARIDEVLVAPFRPPASPTGEELVEISCHGSPVVVRAIQVSLREAGFAEALPGEFSLRAFANGRSDLVRAEAVNEIVAARSEGARAEALKRLEGGLSRRLGEARAALLGFLAEAEVRLDHAEEDGSPSTLFPRDRLAGLRSSLAALAASWRAGRIYVEGASLVIAGRTNAGKSSLFNLLLREERALVSPEEGTTRDWLEAGVELAGFPVRVIDTAGFREASGGVESLGIGKSRALVAGADLVLCVVDSVVGPAREDEELLARRPEALRVWNKVDLPVSLPRPPGWISLSSVTGAGFPDLLAALEAALTALAGCGAASVPARGGGGAGSSSEADPLVSNARQKELLDRAVASLDAALGLLDATSARPGGGDWLDATALELRDSADALGEITGEISSPEVLEAIFSGFCLGK